MSSAITWTWGAVERDGSAPCSSLVLVTVIPSLRSHSVMGNRGLCSQRPGHPKLIPTARPGSKGLLVTVPSLGAAGCPSWRETAVGPPGLTARSLRVSVFPRKGRAAGRAALRFQTDSASVPNGLRDRSAPLQPQMTRGRSKWRVFPLPLTRRQVWSDSAAVPGSRSPPEGAGLPGGGQVCVVAVSWAPPPGTVLGKSGAAVGPSAPGGWPGLPVVVPRAAFRWARWTRL